MTSQGRWRFAPRAPTPRERVTAMLKLLYKPLGVVIGVAGGLAAGAIFARVWTMATGQGDAPQATDPDRGWWEVLVASGIQGAVFGWSKPRSTAAEPPGLVRSPG